MSDRSCTACNDLVEYAPEFVVKGVTDDSCESLANNTGLNPDLDPQHDDCEDLHDINDCLIGNMDDRIEAFNNCEWQDFMHEYIPNTYETLKAIICNDCGQWDRINSLCALLNASMSPPIQLYGIRPDDRWAEYRCGTINVKNGVPLVKPDTNPYDPGTEKYDYWAQEQLCGFHYAKQTINSCEDGSCEVLEWIYPVIFNFYIDSSAAIGDVLWYVSKSELQSVTGFSDYLWWEFDISSYTWGNIPIIGGQANHKYGYLTIDVDPGGMGDNYIGIIFSGTSYPNAAPGYDFHLSSLRGDSKLYRHKCNDSENTNNY